MSEASYYKWKAKYGGLERSDLYRLRQLESENAKLKVPLAEAMMDNRALKDVISKKLVEPQSKRAAAEYVMKRYEFSRRRACGLFGISRSVADYRTKKEEGFLKEKIREIAYERKRYGYRRIWPCFKERGDVREPEEGLQALQRARVVC